MKKIIESTKKNKKLIIIALFLFILAFSIRANLMQYDLLFGFDSYWHARMVGYTIENGALPEIDPLAYYQIGGADIKVGREQPLFWIITAGIYKIFTLGAPYNKELWIIFVKLLPALFGALISVAMFFLFKEIYPKKEGLIAGFATGFIASVVPSFVYRTMSGFFEEDSLGFLWMVLGFLFLIKALKQKTMKGIIINSIISGILFGLMGITWSLFLLVPLIMTLFTVFVLIKLIYLKKKKEIKKVLITIALNQLIMTIILFPFIKVNWISQALNYVNAPLQVIPLTAIAIMLAVAIMAFYILYLISKGKKTETTKEIKEHKSIFNFIKIANLILLLIIVIGLFAVILSKPDFRGEGVLSRTVGEESIGLDFFGEKYGLLIVLPVIALVLVPIVLYKSRKDYFTLLPFFWIMITLFMAASKLKFTYTLGLPIAAAAGIITYYGIKILVKRPKIEKQFLFAILAFVLLSGLASGIFFVEGKTPNIEFNTGWKQSLLWIKNNTPEDAKLFNWWDEGHWITFIGERGVSTDNSNRSFEANRDVAKFIITADLNEAIAIIKEYNSDYILFGDDLFRKQGALGMYAYNTTNSSDKRLQGYFGVSMPCSKQVNKVTGQKTFVCGQNNLPEQQMNALPTTWTNKPTQIMQGKIAMFVYRANDNSRIYLINAKTNKTIYAKMWFNSLETMPYFEEVYFNKEVKLFKVKKENIK